MNISKFLIPIMLLLLVGCVKDETLVNNATGTYIGFYREDSIQSIGYQIIVEGDKALLNFMAPEDPGFISFSGIPEVKNSTEITCFSNMNDEISASTNFIFRGDKISLSTIIFNKNSNDTILYAGIKQ